MLPRRYKQTRWLYRFQVWLAPYSPVVYRTQRKVLAEQCHGSIRCFADVSVVSDDAVLKLPLWNFVCQVEHTRDVMSEVEAVSNQYEGLAVSCSQLYFALETLRDVHFLYHFSLRFFQDILAQVWSFGG